MADETLGSLGVDITGDYSDLSTALDQATQVATDAGASIASAFQQAANATDLAGGSLQIFQSVLQADEEAGISLTQSLTDMAGAASTVGDAVAGAAQSLLDQQSAATDAASSLESVTTASSDASSGIAETGSAAQEAEGGLSGMVEQLTLLGESLAITEGLKEFGQEALTAYGTVQSVTIGLTALTGSAEKADEIVTQIKELAATEPFAFPEIAPTVQRMVALGVSTEQIPVVMQAAADASAATGNAFENVANMLDRMSISGTVNARSLATLGISTTDLGNAMGVTADEAKATFAALDQEDRVNAIAQALSKFAGTAIAEAQGISGQWQIFQNQFEEVMVAVGDALAPVVGDILSFGKVVLSGVQAAAEAFGGLPEPVRDAVVVIGLLVAAIAPLTAALAAVGLGVIGLQGALPALSGLMETLGLSTTEAAAAETALATTSGEAATALGAEAVAAGEAATATEGAGIAATSAMGAITALGGVVAGFAWGWFAGGVKDATDQLNSMTTFAHSLGVNLDTASASGDGLTNAITKLQNIAAQNNITIDQGSKSTQEYALALLQAIQHAQATGAAFQGMAQGVGQADTGVTALTQKVASLQGALIGAQTTLEIVKVNFDLGQASAATLAAATDAVTKAQGALNTELGVAKSAIDPLTASIDAQNAKYAAMSVQLQELPTDMDALSHDVANLAAQWKAATETADGMYTAIRGGHAPVTVAIGDMGDLKAAFGDASSSTVDLGYNTDSTKAKIIDFGNHMTGVSTATSDASEKIVTYGEDLNAATVQVSTATTTVDQYGNTITTTVADSDAASASNETLAGSFQDVANSATQATQSVDAFNAAAAQGFSAGPGGKASSGVNVPGQGYGLANTSPEQFAEFSNLTGTTIYGAFVAYMDGLTKSLGSVNDAAVKLNDTLTGHSLAPALDETTVAAQGLESVVSSISTTATVATTSLSAAQTALKALTSPGALPTAPGPSAGDPATAAQLATLASGGSINTQGWSGQQLAALTDDVKNYTAAQTAYQAALQSWVATTDNGTTSATLATASLSQLQSMLANVQGQIQTQNGSWQSLGETMDQANATTDSLQQQEDAIALQMQKLGYSFVTTTAAANTTGQAFAPVGEYLGQAASGAAQVADGMGNVITEAGTTVTALGNVSAVLDNVARSANAAAVAANTMASAPSGTSVSPTQIDTPFGQAYLTPNGWELLAAEASGPVQSLGTQQSISPTPSLAQIAALLGPAQGMTASQWEAMYGGGSQAGIAGDFAGPAPTGPNQYTGPQGAPATPYGSSPVNITFNANGITPGNSQQMFQQFTTNLRQIGIKVT